MVKKCPVEYTLSLISGKWKTQILKELAHKPTRYSALEKRIQNITPKVLIQHLRQLEEDGLITRTIYPEIPPHVEYALSDKGKSLFTVIFELRQWGILFDANAVNEKCNHCKKCLPI